VDLRQNFVQYRWCSITVGASVALLSASKYLKNSGFDEYNKLSCLSSVSHLHSQEPGITVAFSTVKAI
jgi:hypothetical protein